MIWSSLPGRAEDVAAFIGAPDSPGDVIVLSTTASHAPLAIAGLQQVTILPIDYSGRTHRDLQDPDRPRLFDDDPGALRVRLPSGAGSLYRYGRAKANGLDFGFFHVDPSGVVRLLLERSGVGPSGDQDPFVDRFAISNDGLRLLIATTLAAGGDLLQVDVATAAVTNRTSSLGAKLFGGAGLGLGLDFGCAAMADGFLRFSLTGTADATFVSFPGSPPNSTVRELALSANGAWAVGIAGDPAEHVWIFGANGEARRATTAPMNISAAGYLPQFAGGPWLAVSDDGSVAAWRTEGTQLDPAHEAWCSAATSPVQVAPVQLTADQLFIDTLDEVGQYSFRANQLILGVGESADPASGAFLKIDYFSVDLSAQGGPPTIENLSLSSGQAQSPFTLAPTFEPDLVVWLPQAHSYLLQEDDNTGAPVLWRAPVDGSLPSVLLNNVDSLEFVESAGNGQVVLCIRRASGSKPHQLFVASADLSGALLFAGELPDDTDEPVKATGAGGYVAFVTPGDLGGEFVWRVDTADVDLSGLSPRFLLYSALAFSGASGELAVAVGGAIAPATFAVWPDNSFPYRILTPGSIATYLPSR